VRSKKQFKLFVLFVAVQTATSVLVSDPGFAQAQAGFGSAKSAPPPVKLDRMTERELAAFRKLCDDNNAHAAQFYFEAHPRLNNVASACSLDALNLIALKRLEQATAVAQRALILDPGEPFVLATLAYLLNSTHNSKAAIKNAKYALLQRTDARNLSILAEILEGQKQSYDADKLLAQAERLDSESFDLVAARSRIGQARLSKRDTLEPLNAYLRRHPKNLRALNLRAETLINLGMGDAALRDLSTILVLQPLHTLALQTRADYYSHKENWSLAARDLKVLLFQTPLTVSAQWLTNEQLARCLEGKGDLKGALSAREAVVAFHSKSINVDLRQKPQNINLARAILHCVRLQNRLKQYTKALENTELILKNFPTNVTALEQHAIALEGAGRLQEALHAWTNLVELHRSYPRWLECRAKVYDKLGDKVSAKNDREAIVKLQQ
jgi:tetratricopeptide (TPR) repeat protein